MEMVKYSVAATSGGELLGMALGLSTKAKRLCSLCESAEGPTLYPSSADCTKSRQVSKTSAWIQQWNTSRRDWKILPPCTGEMMEFLHDPSIQ